MTRLTAVSATMTSAVRRTAAVRKSSTGQSATALGSRSQLPLLQPHPQRDQQQPEDEEGRKGDEDDQAGVRVVEQPDDDGDRQRDEHHGA